MFLILIDELQDLVLDRVIDFLFQFLLNRFQQVFGSTFVNLYTYFRNIVLVNLVYALSEIGSRFGMAIV